MTEENEQRKELEMHGASWEDSWFDVEVKAAKLWADRGGVGGSYSEQLLASTASSHRQKKGNEREQAE